MSAKDQMNGMNNVDATDDDQLTQAEATVRLATKDDNSSALLDLINRAYEIGETGIIEKPFSRLLPDELTDMIEQQQLLVLVIMCNDDPKADTKILGCVKVNAVDLLTDHSVSKSTSSQTGGDLEADRHIVGEWGCLAVDPSLQNRGYGFQLVKAAEDYLVREMSCTCLQLELLAPSPTWSSPSVHKERVREWYTKRLGYDLKVAEDYKQSTVSFLQGAKLFSRFVLACDADVTTYRKDSA